MKKHLILFLILFLTALVIAAPVRAEEPMVEFTLTLSVPATRAAAIIDDLAAAMGYEADVLIDKATSSETKPNPETKVEFIKRLMGAELIEKLTAYRAQKAAATASAKAEAETSEAAKAVLVK